MKKQSVALVLGTILLSGYALDDRPGLVYAAGAGSSAAATSPTGDELSAGAAVLQRLIHHGRQYRGNPMWLGVAVGGLLLVGLGSGVVVLLRHSSRAS